MDFVPMAQLSFTQKPGTAEFSGRMLARPLQGVAWKRLGLSDAAAQTNRAAAETKIGDLIIGHIAPTDIYIIKVPNGMDENTLARQLMKTGLYEYVEPDYTIYPAYTPNDPFFGSQWSQSNNNASEAWDICRGDSSLVIGITDTGVHVTHEEFLSNRTPGANSATATDVSNVKTEQVNGVAWVKDLNGHGTHCTGIASAPGGNGKGVTGATIEGTKNKMIRVSDSAGGGSSISALTIGALWAAANGCRVVSTSYSSVQTASIGTTGTTIRNTYNALWFYAAGNDGGTYGASVDWPDVMIIGSIESNNVISGFSARGVFLDCLAPGGNIVSTIWNNDANTASYGNLSGTSMATPYAAGVAIMLLAQNPSYTSQRLEQLVTRTSINMGAATTYGWGRVNLWNAMGRKANLMQIGPGFLDSGVLADLYRQDGTSVVVRPGIVANSTIPPVQIATEHDVPAYAGNNYGEIDIMTKVSLVGATGSVAQKVQILNQTTNTYEDVATGSVNGNVFEGVKTVTAADYANYIVGGKVKVKIQVYPTGPVSNSAWKIAFDQVNVRTLRATE